MNIDIDSAIFIGFLLINLVVGIFYGRGVKTIKDYALGGRNFATGAIVSTIVASWVSGSGFFITLSKTYSDGLLYFIASLGMVVSLGIVALVFVPRMQTFLGFSSIAEVIGNIYGPCPRAIIAVGGIIASIGGIAVQFKVFGTIFNYFLGIEGSIAVCLAGIIITLYSAFGGIRSITFTDVLQFITFGFALPLVGILIWNKVHYDGFNFQTAINSPLFNYKELLSFGNPQFLQTIPLILYFSIPQMGQIEFQRISIGRNIEQVKKAFLIAGVILIFIKLVESWIPFLMYNLNPNLDPNHLLSYIIDNYTYPGLKGLFMIGIIAMTMSCADTDMNAASVFFGNDICKVFNIGFKKELLMSRLFALCLGSGAIFLALSKNDLLSIVLTANSFYMPVATVPCMLTILGFRTTTQSILLGMGAGLATVVTWDILNIEMDCIIFGMLANLIFIIGSHYLLRQPGGWVKAEVSNRLDTTLIKKPSIIIKLMTAIKEFSFIKFCKKTAPKNELMYMGLGIYCILYTFTTMYSTQVELLKENGKIVLVIYQIMMVTGVVTAMYPIWPPRIKKEIIAQIGWNIVIFYMLVLFSSFFVMVSHFGHLQFVTFTVNIIITAILVGWKLSIVMMLYGFYLSIQFYKYYAGIEYLDFTIGSLQFIFMYSLILIGSALIIFLKPKQEYIEATEHKVEDLKIETQNLNHEILGLNSQVTDLNEQVTHYSEQVADKDKEIERLGATAQKILNNVNHELRLPIGNVLNFSEMLNETLEKSDNNLVKELSKEVFDNSNRVSTMILNMLDLATLDIKKVDLQKKTINFGELVEDRVKTCRKIYLRDKKIDFKLKIMPEVMIAVDPNYIRQTIDNLVINAINFSHEGLIKVSVLKENRQVIFTITDQGKGIPDEELSDIFTPFKMGSNSESKACGRGVGLALCKSAVEAHGGSITAESNGKVGATLKFSLPLINN